MYILLTVLMIIICILLVLIVVIQNPKGGGLSASFGGFNNQVLGVQKTNEMLEKFTWYLAIGLLVVSLLSTVFISNVKKSNGISGAKSEIAKSLSGKK